jgi:hypothetical protein
MTPAPQATCPKHPGVPARGACERCGTFGCNDCLTLTTDNKLTCQACLSRGLVDLPSLSGRASLARMALFVTGGLDVAVGVSGLVVTGEEESLLAVLAGFLAIGYLIALIVGIVLYCRWFHLAVRWGAARSVHVGTSPAGAVGSWFIPFVNLVRPFQVMRALLEGRGQDSSPVGLWQAMWIIGNIASNASSRIDNAVLGLIAAALMLGAAFTGVKVIDLTTQALQPSNETQPVLGNIVSG